jgi:hypothetical protein
MLEYINDERLVCQAFQWIVHSARLLTLGELVEALALSDTKLDLNATFADPRDLLMECSSIVYLEKKANDNDGQSINGGGAGKEVNDSVKEYHIRLCHYTVEVNQSQVTSATKRTLWLKLV